MPTPPPPIPPRNRRSPLWLWILLSVVYFAVVALIFFTCCAIIFGSPQISFLENRSAPSGWRTPSPKAIPPDSDFLGVWRPGDPGRAIAFADGTPHTLAPTDTLVLLPDHTYRFTHRGIYDGRSRLICLRTEAGSWGVGETFDGLPRLSLAADYPAIHIDQTVIPDFNLETDDQLPVSKVEQMTDRQQDERIDDHDNASNCSTSSPRDNEIGEWRVVTASGGRLGIFRDAPGMAYESTLIPWHIVPVSQILYQHDR